LWVIFALLDTDQDCESKSGYGSSDPGFKPDPDTDPQHWASSCHINKGAGTVCDTKVEAYDSKALAYDTKAQAYDTKAQAYDTKAQAYDLKCAGI
jgi:hypothetical protein